MKEQNNITTGTKAEEFVAQELSKLGAFVGTFISLLVGINHSTKLLLKVKELGAMMSNIVKLIGLILVELKVIN